MANFPATSRKPLPFTRGVMLPVLAGAILCLFTAVHDLRFTFGGFACAMIVLALALRRARQLAFIQVLLWITAAVAISTLFVIGPHVHA